MFLSFEIRIRKCKQNYQMMIMRQQHVGPARKMEFEKQRLDNTIEHLKSSGNSEQKDSCIEIFSLKKKKLIIILIRKDMEGRLFLLGLPF